MRIHFHRVNACTCPTGRMSLPVWLYPPRSSACWQEAHFWQALNMDNALFLHFGKLLLLGRMPYVDFVDFNPPLTHYIHAVPVFLAGLLGTSVG